MEEEEEENNRIREELENKMDSFEEQYNDNLTKGFALKKKKENYKNKEVNKELKGALTAL
jgi:hypothetical protein